MRKVDPRDVRADFQQEADLLMAFMARMRRALEGAPHEKRDVSRLAAMVFLDLYVAFERFLSDLFLAYLNRDFSQYQKQLEDRILQATGDRKGKWARDRTRFDPVKHVKVADLESIVCSSGWNLTFASAEDIRQKASDWLVRGHRRRIRSITDHDERLIDTAHAIRDFIAHESPASKDRMNDLLSRVSSGVHNRYLARGQHKVHNVGAYLKAVFDRKRRIAIYAERLREIAGKM